MHESLRQLPLLFCQTLWRRRAVVFAAIAQIGQGLGWIYQQLPLPNKLRRLLPELAFNALEHAVLRHPAYAQWQQQRSGLNALHGLLGTPEATQTATAPAAICPTEADWQALGTPPSRDHAELAVVVPVYRGYDETLRCLYQLVSSRNDIAYKLVVINDASPDVALTDKLNALAGQGWFELLTHRQNCGFVQSVNSGMAQYPTLDVVLLNADTEVYDGWLDRLIQALYSSARVASATPLSNCAELCSYPQSFDANTAPLEIDYAWLDALAATLPKRYTPLPTGVGFCMALRRAALDELGVFDAEHFGRGYGEENDWCLRASAQGWQHVAADNVFVRHHGNVSFSHEKQALLKQSLRKLNKRYPHYRALVRAFTQQDPLLPTRRALDEARLKQLCTAPNCVLMLSHNAGGGTERHVQEMSAWLREEGVAVLRLSPDVTRQGAVRLWHDAAGALPNLSYHLNTEAEALMQLLQRLGVSHLHLHHLTGFAPAILPFITRICRELACHYDVTIHDYYMACPSVNLLLDNAYMAQTPSLQQSEDWARKHPSPAGSMPVWQWREQHRQLLFAARHVFVPNEDVVTRMQALFDGLQTSLRPHPEQLTTAQQIASTHGKGEVLHIAVIGRLTKHKGYDVLLQLAQDAKARSLPITYHLFGDVATSKPLADTGKIRLHGAYQEENIGALLQQHACQVALFVSVWPETYSYTLSIALTQGLYPVCYDIGAPAQRLKALGFGHVLPRIYFEKPSRTNDDLLALETSNAPKKLGLADKQTQYASLWCDYYGN